MYFDHLDLIKTQFLKKTRLKDKLINNKITWNPVKILIKSLDFQTLVIGLFQQ